MGVLNKVPCYSVGKVGTNVWAMNPSKGISNIRAPHWTLIFTQTS